jgi:MFS family permease
MSEPEFAFVSSIFTLGGFLGALSGGPISTRYGRLLTMRVATFASILGSCFEAFASHLSVIAIGRVLSGAGAGLSLVVVPLYISEIAPPESKGLFGATTQIAVNSGILFTLILGSFFSEGSEWRIILAAGAGIAIFQGFALIFVSESPAWLALHKDSETAVRLLQRIRGKGVDVQAEIQGWNMNKEACDGELEALLDHDDLLPRHSTSPSKPDTNPTPQIGFLEVVRNPLYRPALIAVIGIMLAQQLTGINSVMMYSVTLLSSLFPTTSTLLTILLSLINLLLTILCAPLPDLLGRKPTLLLSISGMGLSALSLAFAMLFNIKILTGISALGFVAAFGMGLGAIPFILASELVDPEASAPTQSWGLAVNWMATFAVAQFCPMANEGLNRRFGGAGWVFFVFAALALLSAGFVVWWVPETRGKMSADEVWDRI